MKRATGQPTKQYSLSKLGICGPISSKDSRCKSLIAVGIEHAQTCLVDYAQTGDPLSRWLSDAKGKGNWQKISTSVIGMNG